MQRGSGYWKFINNDCSNKKHVPHLSIVLNDIDENPVEFRLSSEDIIIQEKDKKGIEHCVPGFMPMDIPGKINTSLFVLGNNFIRKYYSIFDRDNMMVGFMKANHERQTSDLKLVQ
ncbi:plasmepsin VI-like [Hylaeus volcanicus]|uniref:plasmepsin VI-like n=1 Tax=Hylaeus volcanicus TaxID=313075 RepID=UPI0023B84E7C|nr:plasmepsin VI-like [Hylaeus volcanicus]